MNLNHLNCFFEIAKSKSFTLAAKKLKVSQPAVSRMLLQLEENLGKKLIERNKKTFHLTFEGELLFEATQKIFSEVNELKEKLNLNEKVFSGPWTLGVSDNLAIHLLPNEIAKFKVSYPKLKVSVFTGTSSQIKTEILSNRANLGIFYTQPSLGEQLEFMKIGDVEFVLVFSKKHFSKRIKTVQDLKKYKIPKIESRHRDYSAGFPAQFLSSKLDLKESPWIEVNNHEVKKKLVLLGYGYSILTKHSVLEEINSGFLNEVAIDKDRMMMPVFAVWKKGERLDYISQEFLNKTRAVFNH